MMADGFVHTVHKGGEWLNEIEGGAEFGGTHSTKEEAVAAGRVRAMQDGTEHVIHTEDGVIGERSSYGNDPASRPG
jgi:Mn-containing catalase